MNVLYYQNLKQIISEYYASQIVEAYRNQNFELAFDLSLRQQALLNRYTYPKHRGFLEYDSQ